MAFFPSDAPETDILYDSSISSFLSDRRAGIWGFADLSPIPEERRYGFPRSISFGFPISKKILAQIKAGPTIEYFREYDRLNGLLAKAAKETVEYINSIGYSALAIDEETRRYDTAALATILPHKTSAVLAGLGWIGKCDLLITRGFGSGIRLGTVLTDLPLRTGTPTTESQCGSCGICRERCPGGAVAGRNWKSGMNREELYDAFACQATARRLSAAIGAEHSICGICIANCPITIGYMTAPET